MNDGKDIIQELGFYTVPDLTEEDRKPPDMIVKGMISVGLNFLSGAPKTRKSFLAIMLAVAVALGMPFLGFPTTQCDVCYFDLEGSKSRISNRVEHMRTKVPKNVYITHSCKERLGGSGKLPDQIREIHRQHPAIRLFIIDTFSRAKGNYRSGGANAYDVDVSLLEPVQRMAIEENIAVLFIHHDKKGASYMQDSFERISGTMGISGSADSVLNLITEGKRFEGKATLEYTPRDAKGGEIQIAFNDYFLEWEVSADPKADMMGNPVCAWIVKNAPDPKKDAKFVSYAEVYSEAYRSYSESSGDVILPIVKKYQNDLFLEHGIAVQASVANNSKRGIRMMRI